MHFRLENIPEQLWGKIECAAAARGKSPRDFLLDAAFNEIERTASFLPSVEPLLSHLPENPPSIPPLTNSRPEYERQTTETQGGHLRNLRTIGIKTFIVDFEKLRDWSNNELVTFFRDNYDYAYTSANTKASMGKRIIKDKAKLYACLNYIAHQAKNVDHSLKEKARRLLDELFRGI